MSDYPYELLQVTSTDILGEGPWWDAARGELLWVDILGRRIRRSTLDGTEAPEIATPSDVGFAVRTDTGLILAGLAAELATTDPDTGDWTTLWTAAHNPAEVRTNDGKTDRKGRVWFGTMHRDETLPIGSFYRHRDGEVTEIFDDITVSNGLGWSPNDRTFYYTDSLAYTIWAFDSDPETGEISGRRVFATDTDCLPDGLTVDADGGIWCAKWNGGRIVRYRPDGEIDRVIEMPVAKPTSLTFAGPNLDVLAVTSANRDPGDGQLAGSVFLLDVGVSGIPEQPASL